MEIGIVALAGSAMGTVTNGGFADPLILTADHDNWEVREWAADALSISLSGMNDPRTAILALDAWARHASPNVRRIIVVGIRHLALADVPDMLGVLTPLMADPDP